MISIQLFVYRYIDKKNLKKRKKRETKLTIVSTVKKISLNETRNQILLFSRANFSFWNIQILSRSMRSIAHIERDATTELYSSICMPLCMYAFVLHPLKIRTWWSTIMENHRGVYDENVNLETVTDECFDLVYFSPS